MTDKICKSKKIEWELILKILDIHNYLNLKNNLEVSAINKVLREKYKKVLFKNLIYKKFDLYANSYNNLLREVKSISSNENSEDHSNFKATNLDPFVSRAIKEISAYSAYFTSLSLSSLNEICYYFIPSIGTFNNLARLKIDRCFVSAKDFSILMKKLNKLECLELYGLVFTRTEDEGNTERNILLPPSVKKLALELSTAIITTLPSNPYDFIYTCTVVEEEEFFYLAQHLPNLKYLRLTATFSTMTNTNELLTLNPQLTHLSLPIENINMETIRILSKSKVKRLNLFLIHFYTIPSIQSEIYTLKSVTSLTIPFISQIGYPTLKKLFPLFPSLTKLTVKMRGYNVEYLTEIAANTRKLEVINIDINDYITKDIDLTMFCNVDHIKLKILDSSKILYKFPSHPANLKSVAICTDMQYLKSYNYMKEKYMKNSDWDIKLIHKTIYCTRLKVSE